MTIDTSAEMRCLLVTTNNRQWVAPIEINCPGRLHFLWWPDHWRPLPSGCSMFGRGCWPGRVPSILGPHVSHPRPFPHIVGAPRRTLRMLEGPRNYRAPPATLRPAPTGRTAPADQRWPNTARHARRGSEDTTHDPTNASQRVLVRLLTEVVAPLPHPETASAASSMTVSRRIYEPPLSEYLELTQRSLRVMSRSPTHRASNMSGSP